ncbi:hypothetical protein GUJ93_ZPchr0002g23038 [Zizania palustris]|uniref:Lipoyl-binding domain-containing protein n=1 Tax=Zizania palustris TaxID=103762 RepID=A0A8J5V395_ZIZPA|nr:hypothetical protein GUJ93_ZPchr0002g23038 [Zizania palustris]
MTMTPAPFSLSASTLLTRQCARRAVVASPQRWRMVVHAKIHEIFMLALSSTMTEGKIISWTVAEGDRVNKGGTVVVV